MNEAAQAASSYTITANALIGGILLLGVSIIGFFVKKWIDDTKEALQGLVTAIDKKDAENHGTFQQLFSRDEEAMKLITSLRVEMATTVKQSELGELYKHIDQSKDAIIKAVSARPGSGLG